MYPLDHLALAPAPEGSHNTYLFVRRIDTQIMGVWNKTIRALWSPLVYLFDSCSAFLTLCFCALFLYFGITRGMPHGRLPLSVTNHSLLLGCLPQAITSWSMPHGRMPLAITNQSMPQGRLPLLVLKKPEYAAWTLATFLVSELLTPFVIKEKPIYEFIFRT